MRKILVIDDDESIRMLLYRFLTEEGYEVSMAANGQDGHAQHQSNQFDLVITDLFMPGKDGLEFIQEVKAEHPDVRIIAISGGGRMKDRDLLKVSKALGADHVLQKPFNPFDLMAVIETLF
ncbi:MAG: response regulator transcription factor [Solirubrobacterales bacterium]